MTFKIHEYQLTLMLGDPNKFPWDVMGWRHPRLGNCYSYLCEFMAQYSKDEKERTFMRGKPSLRELENYNKLNPSTDYISFILRYQNQMDEDAVVGKQVLGFFKNSMIVQNDMEDKINKAVRSGLYEVKKHL